MRSVTPENELYYLEGLKASLEALSLSVAVQAERFTGTCKPCALMTDFYSQYWSTKRYSASALSEEQRVALEEVQKKINELSMAGDYECWTDEPIRTGSAWQELRAVSLRALEVFA